MRSGSPPKTAAWAGVRVKRRAGFTQVNERLDGLGSKVELSETMDDRFSHLLAVLIKAGLADLLRSPTSGICSLAQYPHRLLVLGIDRKQP